MKKNFTELAFTENVKNQQEKYGTRNLYARMEKSIERFDLANRRLISYRQGTVFIWPP